MSQPDSGPPVNSQGPSNGSSSAMPCQSGPNVLHPPRVTGSVVPQHPYNAYPIPPYHSMPHHQPTPHYPPSHPAHNHTYFSASFAPIQSPFVPPGMASPFPVQPSTGPLRYSEHPIRASTGALTSPAMSTPTILTVRLPSGKPVFRCCDYF
ncbi:BZ3500_MvSof-1268-A1-R1_Chr1-1g01071 [Microbotryum saponariae]|uniref:BZ3500_MvSof-1268-A1-R1_Chr1-1g01071 protein n=1 Tax=Microbotryum saponariae TaxID=289078 RepID=A0A2X0KPI5_9BASI|nr:BZ3500_MvSof-1268-A1-R1_Chr1-1g01071 [Microbotryum saponariae]SCZ93356.1 BZ3501_MvSof-1269-A2-R1_Chr1-1g00668 [Microbotryum saponariae]